MRHEQQREVLQDGERYHWHRQTIAETFERIRSNPREPWVAIGDFLDDWRFTEPRDRGELIQESIASSHDDSDMMRWAAFLAAMVEWLCWQEKLPFPT